MKQISSLFRMNPIIVKEIRSRMRGPRAFITLTIVLLTMGLIMYGVLQLILAGARYSNVLSPQIGQILFAALMFLELFMICAITPAVTAGAISGEKEKQTYEMLMATPLSPASVLWGKLISALSYVLLLLFAGIPLASIVFIFGGVAPREMLKSLLVLGVIAISFGILGLFLSALFGRTGRATVASFILVVLLMVGPIFLAGLIGVLRNSEPPRWILAPSPISAISSTLAPMMGVDMGGSFFYILAGIFNLGVAPISQTSIPRPLYHYTIPFYAVLSLVLYLLATRLVQPARRWRIRAKDLLMGIGSLLVLIGAITGVYFATANRYEWVTNPQGTIMPTVAPVMAFPGPSAIQKEVGTVQAEPLTATPTPTPASNTEGGMVPAPQPVDEKAQAEIYAAVARQLYTIDHTFGNNPPNWKGLYLIYITNDGVGDPNTEKRDPLSLSDTVRTEINTQIKDLPAKIMWVESRDQVGIDANTGQVDGGSAAIITFGNVHVQKDGSVQVPASLYFGNLGATGKTYVLNKVDGVWKITGTTGVEWIS